MVEIHEFSTGIRFQQTSQSPNGWVSLGFLGQYMNVTCDLIPNDIERAIANKLFAVSEGASSEKPAIIGRVINNYSVVALVSKGWD